MSIIQSFKVGGDDFLTFLELIKIPYLKGQSRICSLTLSYISVFLFYLDFSTTTSSVSPISIKVFIAQKKKRKESTVSRNCSVPQSLMKSLIK